MEECADSMGQRSSDAVATGATTELKMVECASNMGQRSNYAITPVDVQIMPRRVESVSNTVQRSNASCAVVRDVPTLLNEEECVNATARQPNNAEPWDVLIKLLREESVEDMGRRKSRNYVTTLEECVQI
jgi:hypothetical protein